jgi:tetratricopeptide (TPR) repeat protein
MAAVSDPTACTKSRRDRPTIGRWAATLALLAALLAGPAALADQSDPRLDDLFARLKVAETADAAQPIEAEIWDRWMQSGDERVDALMTAGVTALNETDFDTALEAFSQVVVLAPKFAEGWNKRATTLYLLGRFGDSMTDIDRVLGLEPRHFGALSGLGLILQEIGDDKHALEAYRRALAIDPHLEHVGDVVKTLREKVEGRDI